jgi:N-acyl-phosphatidylethanolamine-hydrolysing phospholipase D
MVWWSFRALIGPALLVLACTPPAGRIDPMSSETPRDLRALLYAPHGAVGGFRNPWSEARTGTLDFLRWQLSRNAYDKSRAPVIPVVANDGRSLAGREGSASLTWVGHATFAVHDDEDVFLTDPHFGPRALLPKRRTPPGVPLESIPAHAFAVVSHNHYDHLDAFSVDRLPKDMPWFVPLGLASWFRARGRENVVELDWWQSAQHGRWSVTCVPVQHWSARIEHGRNKTLWCGWLLDSGKRRFFFAGDTGYFHGFEEIGRRFGSIDVAMLPIGAYEPRWFMRSQHMDPSEAYRAFRDLGARYMVPMHWGTFDLTDEPLDEAPRELARVLETSEEDPSRVRVMAVGERWRVPDAKDAGDTDVVAR